MISVTFPDGAARPFEPGVNGFEIAKSISPSLAKRAVAMTVDGALHDLADPLTTGCGDRVRNPRRSTSTRTHSS